MADTDISQDTINLEENQIDESSDVNYIEDLPKEFLDAISPQIYALPERIRNEEEGKYIFPEEYHNKIYRFNNKFLLFNSTSYEEVSYPTVSFFLKLCQLFTPDLSSVNNISEHSEEITTKLEFCINKINEISKQIETNPNQSSDVDVDEIKTQLKQIIESYNSDNNELINKFKSQENTINELQVKLVNLENILKDFKLPKIPTESLNIEDILNNEELINKIGTIIWNKLQTGDQDYLNVSLFNQFKEHVETQLSILHNKTLVNNNKPETKTHIDDGIPLSEVLKQFQVVPTSVLIQLKLAGFTSEEILQLREKGALGEWDYK